MTENKNNKKIESYCNCFLMWFKQAKFETISCIIVKCMASRTWCKLFSLEFSNIKIELLEPIDKNSPISNYWKKYQRWYPSYML